MKRPIIYNSEPLNFSDKAREIYRSFGEYREFQDGDPLPEFFADADAVIVRFGFHVDEKVLAQTPKLKAIISATTGLNHIPQVIRDSYKVKIISLKGEREFLETITATAEHTWLLLLSLYRNLPAAVAQTQAYTWDRDALMGKELRGKTIGVIGYGRLGSKVASYAQCFGMRVLAYDTQNPDVASGVEKVDLEMLLRDADVVSLHIPGSEDNYGFFGADKIAKMKRGALLINTARGEILDESDFLSALETGQIGGAALDVLQGENTNNPDWLAENLLIKYAQENSNLLITPHIGGATYCSLERVEEFVAQKTKDFFTRF